MTYIKNIETANNFVSLADTSFIKEQISTTIEYYKGTEVIYTPTEGSSKVVYECNLQTAWTPSGEGSYSNSRLQYSTDGGTTWTEFDGTRLFCGSWSSNVDNVWSNYNWTEINAKYRKNIGHGGSNTSQKYRYYINWKFIVPSWSGPKQLRIQIASHVSNININLHQIPDWDGSSSSNTFCNTNLIVYSI